MAYTKKVYQNGTKLKAEDMNHIEDAIETLDLAMLGKADKETDKVMTANDYTDSEKQKLAGIEENANHYVHPSYPALNGKPDVTLTRPEFGGPITVSQVHTDNTGHVTSLQTCGFVIPKTPASTTKAGIVKVSEANGGTEGYTQCDTYTDSNGVIRTEVPYATADRWGTVRLGDGFTQSFTVRKDAQGNVIYNQDGSPSFFYNGTISVRQMQGAWFSETGGLAGTVPQPKRTDAYRFLNGLGNWVDLWPRICAAYPTVKAPIDPTTHEYIASSQPVAAHNAAIDVPPEEIRVYLPQSPDGEGFDMIKLHMNYTAPYGETSEDYDIDLTVHRAGIGHPIEKCCLRLQQGTVAYVENMEDWPDRTPYPVVQQIPYFTPAHEFTVTCNIEGARIGIIYRLDPTLVINDLTARIAALEAAIT